MRTKEVIEIINEELTKDFNVVKNEELSASTRKLYGVFLNDARKLKSCNYHDFVFWFKFYRFRSDISYYVYRQTQKQLNQYFI